MRTDQFTRRRALQLAAVGAGGVTLAACSPGSKGSGSGGDSGGKETSAEKKVSKAKGSKTDPMPKPAAYTEAPGLTAQVKAGKLPAVEKRLPDNPYVVPHNWVAKGKYGGKIRTICVKTDDAANMEYMYGHSPLRWLNDGQDITGGLVEKWESNADTSEWVLHLRKGLKWSDGQPFTTEDIMFWWEDMVLNEEHPEQPPDEARSGKGTLMKMTAPDAHTLKMSFDAPTPLTADRLAMWVKRGNGPVWLEPKHYLKQYHPRYNKSVGKDWYDAKGDFETKRAWARNPGCPTMTGWMCKSYADGRQVVFERNPYYWCVSPDGAQLPYIDQLVFDAAKDTSVQKIAATQGKVNFLYAGFTGIFLDDIAPLQDTESKTKLEVVLWDAGDGSGSLTFFNQDYKEPKMRALIRNDKFRQALSHAFNRERVQRSVYYNTGEITTGTMSPKAIEFHKTAEGKKVYKDWRDSYVKYDPALAKKLLDQIGVVDKDGDGKREMPDGTKLVVRLDFQADTAPEHISKCNLLKKDWEAVGIQTEMNPVPPQGYPDQWRFGNMMTNVNWETGDGPNCLVYPQWMVPIESSRWAPLQGQMYALRGTPDYNKQKNVDPYKRTPPRAMPEKGSPVDELWKLYDQSKVEPDAMKRSQLVWQMIKIHVDHGPYLMGVCANTPYVLLVHHDMRNVPRKANLQLGGFAAPWIHPSPGVYDPETWYWENPSEHDV